MSSFLRKVRVALTPRDSLLKTTLAEGGIVYGKNRAGFGGRGIYVYRDAIEPEFEHLTKFLDSSGVFVDVGANTGIYSIKAARHFDNRGTVISLEPFPDVFATLYRSVQANGFTNVRLRCLCAGAQTEARPFWMNEGKPHEFSLIQYDAAAASMTTLAVKLDDLLRWEGLEGLDFLKIDAEGAEQSVLAGARQVIAKYRPIIQVEISVRDSGIDFEDYRGFQAPGSPNKLYIPKGHAKCAVPARLGWREINVEEPSPDDSEALSCAAVG